MAVAISEDVVPDWKAADTVIPDPVPPSAAAAEAVRTITESSS